MKHWKVAALIFGVFLLFVIYWADTGTMPSAIRAVYNFPYGDKVGHFVLYGMLALLLNGAAHQRTIKLLDRPLVIGSLIAASLALIEEITQIYFPNRSFDLIDLGAGLFGIWFAGNFSRK